MISRAMAKRPADRYQRGLEFALDVHELRENLTSDKLEDRARTSTHHGHPRRAYLFDLASAGSPYSAIALADGWRRKTFASTPALLRRIFRRPSMLFAGFAFLMAALATMTWYRTSSTAETSPPSRYSKAGMPANKVAPYELEPVQPPTMQAKQAADSSNSDGKSQRPKSPRVAGQQQTSRPAAPPPNADSALLIDVEHHFSDGSISVWSADELLYSHSLQTESKKRLILFRTAQGHAFSTVLLIAGQHHLRVHAHSTSDDYDEFKTISGNFTHGQKRTLQITFHGKQNDMHLELR